MSWCNEMNFLRWYALKTDAILVCRENFCTISRLSPLWVMLINSTLVSTNNLSQSWKYFFHCRSNCNPEIAQILRQHYKRPNFLPDDSESSAIDWIFMGYSERGASMHVSQSRESVRIFRYTNLICVSVLANNTNL